MWPTIEMPVSERKKWTLFQKEEETESFRTPTKVRGQLASVTFNGQCTSKEKTELNTTIPVWLSRTGGEPYPKDAPGGPGGKRLLDPAVRQVYSSQEPEGRIGFLAGYRFC